MTVEAYLGLTLLVISVLLGLRQLTAPWRKKVKKTRVWLDKFMRDWEGENEEGRLAVPGVMERLNKLDGELSNNGGKSLKDTVEKTQKDVTSLKTSVDGMDARLHRIEQAITNNYTNNPPSPLL